MAIFRTAQPVFPCFISSAVSMLNVEKVLNPPQIPVSKNNLNEDDSIFTAKNFNAIAKIRQAIMLADNVAIGNDNDER